MPEASDSVHKPNDSVHNEVDSVHKPNDSVHNEADSVTSEALLAIAAPSRRQERLPPEETEKIILALCEGRWLTRNQLAALLDRNPDGLRSRFLTSMVAHGHLRLRYPDKPNRTDQVYTAGGAIADNDD